MANNREFILFYGDNQESNSFLALHNVQKYLPGLAGSVKNESSTYPNITTGKGNETFWYPQEINSPLTTVNSSVAANFFPVRLPPLSSLFNSCLFCKRADEDRSTATYSPTTPPSKCVSTTRPSGT